MKNFPPANKKSANSVSIVDVVDCVHMELIKAFPDTKKSSRSDAARKFPTATL